LSTRLGLVVIEIQGELNYPTRFPIDVDDDRGDENNTEDEERYIEEVIGNEYIADAKLKQAIRIGRLEIDEHFMKCILYIGKSQRLIGSIEKLENPIGLLKFPRIFNDKDYQNKKIEIIDIVNYKIIFKNRPLPIM
ncbi:Ctf8p ASCRUDRAFT_23115, partial [Ascoidea rubescens DSM 1968]